VTLFLLGRTIAMKRKTSTSSITWKRCHVVTLCTFSDIITSFPSNSRIDKKLIDCYIGTKLYTVRVLTSQATPKKKRQELNNKTNCRTKSNNSNYHELREQSREEEKANTYTSHTHYPSHRGFQQVSTYTMTLYEASSLLPVTIISNYGNVVTTSSAVHLIENERSPLLSANQQQQPDHKEAFSVLAATASETSKQQLRTPTNTNTTVRTLADRVLFITVWILVGLTLGASYSVVKWQGRTRTLPIKLLLPSSELVHQFP